MALTGAFSAGFAKKSKKKKIIPESKSLWYENESKSLITDAKEYYASQEFIRGTRLSIVCFEGSVRLLFNFNELLFDISEIAYRLDKEAATIATPNPYSDPRVFTDDLAWIESADSKSIGLWDATNVEKFSALFTKHSQLTIQVKHKYGSATAIYVINDANKYVNKAVAICNIPAEKSIEDKPNEAAVTE